MVKTKGSKSAVDFTEFLSNAKSPEKTISVNSILDCSENIWNGFAFLGSLEAREQKVGEFLKLSENSLY